MSAIQQMLAAGKYVPPDTTPDAFSFTDQSGVEPGVLTYSNTITITGINAPTSVSLSGGDTPRASINGLAFGLGGTISNNQTLRIRQTSSTMYGVPGQVLVNVGGVATYWTVTTRAADTMPFSFSFPSNVTGATPNQTYYSDMLYLSGMDPNVDTFISVYSSAGSPLLDTGSPGTGLWVVNRTVTTDFTGGFYVQVRMAAPPTVGSIYTATLNCAGVSANWSIST